jgi:hypothetical protein
MRILNYSPGADRGGVGHLLKRAFDAHTDWDYRQVARSVNYIHYPRDLARADPLTFDVVHANNRIGSLPLMPTVVHYHGTGFRANAGRFLNEQRARGAAGLASTLDLWLLAPDELTWCPAPYDLDWLMSHRAPVDDGVLRVGHSPTRRAIKSTDGLIAAVKRLRREVNVELVLTERKTWAECLSRKGTVDVYFDQVILGYGSNAIEAWGMGLPVICGGAPGTLAEMRSRFGELPFYEATEDTIYEALVAMADPAVRATWSERGLAHVQRFHDAAAVVELLKPIYRAAHDARTL